MISQQGKENGQDGEARISDSLCSGTNKRIAPLATHFRIPSRVLFLTPATRAESSAIQLKILRLGGSSLRGLLSADCGPVE